MSNCKALKSEKVITVLGRCKNNVVEVLLKSFFFFVNSLFLVRKLSFVLSNVSKQFVFELCFSLFLHLGWLQRKWKYPSHHCHNHQHQQQQLLQTLQTFKGPQGKASKRLERAKKCLQRLWLGIQQSSQRTFQKTQREPAP